jgi:hypothetical protein
VIGARRAAVLAGALLSGAAAAPACELVLAEHRSGRELARLPLDAARPSAQIAFTHSVLGTPVADRYVWRSDGAQWRAHLIEERFEGDGYGLPNAAASGESLTRDGNGWRLQLDRVVHPLVVLPLPAQGMRLVVGERAPLLLGSLSRVSIAMRAENCVQAAR